MRRPPPRHVAAGLVLVAAFLLAASTFDVLSAEARPQETRSSSECGQRVTVVGARGSGDAQSGDQMTDKYGDPVHGMGKPGAAFAVALANRLPRGAVTFDPIIYPAVGLLGNWRKIVNAVGAGTKIGFLGSYNGSVNDGKAALRQVIKSEARVCPRVKLVLVGYSQGAQVVADVYQRDLTAGERSRIAGVVLFGDPYFNPGDSKPDVGSYDPTRYGALGKRGFYPSSNTTIFSICHLYDPICQGPGRDKFSQHGNYQNDPWIKVAAAKIAAAFKSDAPAGGLFLEGHLLGLAQSTKPAEVERRWGTPTRRSSSSSGLQLWYPGIHLYFTYFNPPDPTSAFLSGITVTSASFRTPHGIHVGSSLANVQAAYPQAEVSSDRVIFSSTNEAPEEEGALVRNGRVTALYFAWAGP